MEPKKITTTDFFLKIYFIFHTIVKEVDEKNQIFGLLFRFFYSDCRINIDKQCLGMWTVHIQNSSDLKNMFLWRFHGRPTNRTATNSHGNEPGVVLKNVRD